MKKKYMQIISICLCAGILAGCQETPKNSIVKQKGAESIKQYESMGESEDAKGENQNAKEGSLKDILGAKEHYTNQATYENGVLVIDTDADVILPEVNVMNTYSVSAKEVNQDMIDKVTNAFFEKEDKFYSMYTYSEWTKEKYQERITILKKYKAEGNLDPYEYGKDENGELQFNIDEQIERYEQEMKDAPEEVIKEEVKPSFGIEWVSDKEKNEKEIDTDCFFGIVETKHGNYNYQISYGLKPDITFKISKIREDLEDTQEFSDWLEGEYLLDRKSNNYKNLSEDFIKEKINMSYEDAEKIAKEKVEKLGWDMEIYGSDYTVFYHGEGGAKEDNVLDGGYLFHFSRILDGAPITYTSCYGGALEDMDSTLVPWSYERCDVIVGDDGIQEVEIFNPYDIGEIQTKNVKLMDFESIMKIYEQMMEVSNADIAEFEKSRVFHIKKIALGYSRMYDPTKDNDTGLIVPTWDFFGRFDSDIDGYSEKDSGEHSTQSFMTINAIDGTVINRDLGY